MPESEFALAGALGSELLPSLTKFPYLPAKNGTCEKIKVTLSPIYIVKRNVLLSFREAYLLNRNESAPYCYA